MRVLMIGAAAVALGACGGNAANNMGNKGAPAANVAAPSTNNLASAQAPAAAPTDDPVRRAIAARWPAGLPVTPAEVREMVRRTNASDTVVALVGRSEISRWQTVLRGIALGEPEWIGIANLLVEAVDGEGAETFFSALSDMLVTSPADAVRLIGADGAEGYCSDNGAITNVAERNAYYSAAISGVEAISDPALQAAKAECLRHLRSASAG